MNRIKIIHHSKTVGFSGTDRTAQLFCKYLDKSKYDVYLLYRQPDSANCRLDIVKEWLGEDKVIPYYWKPGKRTQHPPYFPEEDNYSNVVQNINPSLIHFHSSGYNEFPAIKYLSPKTKFVTTNIFGYKDETNQSDQIIYISEFNRQRALAQGEKDGPVLPNPIELPKEFLATKVERQNINAKFSLNIPIDGLWCLRVGRPDNPNATAIKAFSEIVKIRPFIQYLIVGPCELIRQYAKGVPNIHFIDQVIEDEDLRALHSAADIYLHYREDGEICSTAIAQAMMYELPIISHKSKIYNGQVEMLDGVGYCAKVDDFRDYALTLLALVDDINLRSIMGQKAHNKAKTEYEASIVTKKLEAIYDQVLRT